MPFGHVSSDFGVGGTPTDPTVCGRADATIVLRGRGARRIGWFSGLHAVRSGRPGLMQGASHSAPCGATRLTREKRPLPVAGERSEAEIRPDLHPTTVAQQACRCGRTGVGKVL